MDNLQNFDCRFTTTCKGDMYTHSVAPKYAQNFEIIELLHKPKSNYENSIPKTKSVTNFAIYR